MHLHLAAVGQRPPAWVTDAWNEYRKRFPPNLQVELREIPLGHRGRNPDLRRARRQEGEAMLAAVGDDAQVVALEVTGKPWSTEALAQRLQRWMEEGRDTWFLVGGPDGLDDACLRRANARMRAGPWGR